MTSSRQLCSATLLKLERNRFIHIFLSNILQLTGKRLQSISRYCNLTLQQEKNKTNAFLNSFLFVCILLSVVVDWKIIRRGASQENYALKISYNDQQRYHITSMHCGCLQVPSFSQCFTPLCELILDGATPRCRCLPWGFNSIAFFDCISDCRQRGVSY